jgi:hypothetical protein
VKIPFFSRPDNSKLLTQGIAAGQEAEASANALREEKEDLILRQSELWSLPSLNPELEDEYRRVGERIQYIARKLFVLDEYSHVLGNARYTCQQDGKCEALAALGASADYATDARIDAASPTQSHIVL